MTREEFEAKYKLLDRVGVGSVRTYHAVASSGAVVMAHFLDDGDEARAILDGIEVLDADRRSRVLKVLEVDGAPVVVTRFILDFRSLQSWVGVDDSAAAVPPTIEVAAFAPDRPTPPPASEASGPGEFTRLFRAPDIPEPPPAPPEPPPVAQSARTAESLPSDAPAPAPSVEPTSAAEPPPVDEDRDTAGEFTRLFRAVSAQGGSSDAPAPTSSAAPTGPPRSGLPAEPPTEPPSEPRTEPPPEPRPERRPETQADEPHAVSRTEHVDAPGEFTRLFRAAAPAEGAPPATADPPAGDPTPAPEPPPPSPGPKSAEPSGAGEFTRLFHAPLVEPESDPAPPPPAAPAGGTPPADPVMPAPEPDHPQESGPPGAGEFTRMFRAAEPTIGSSAADPSGEPHGRDERVPPVAPLFSPTYPAQPAELRTPRLDAPPAVPPAPDPPPGRPAPVEPQDPGEFTRIFGRQQAPADPGAPSPPPMPPAQSADGAGIPQETHGYLERLQTPGGPQQPAVPPALPPAPSTPPRAEPGPSEFTRIIKVPQAAPPAASAPKPAPEPVPAPPAGGTSLWPYVLGFVLILLAALALILFVVLLGT